MTHADAIREWLANFETGPTPIPVRALRAVDDAGLAPPDIHPALLRLIRDDVWQTYWLIVAEVLESIRGRGEGSA